MLCAGGAVACLAVFNVQWSRQLPVQPNHWEQNLFGDLAVPAAPAELEQTPELARVPSLPELVDAGGAARPVLIENRSVLIENRANPSEVSHPASSEHQPLDHQPVPSHERFIPSQAQLIQPVQHQHQPPEAAPTAWLSGGIELLSDDPAPSSEAGVQYFPDAHRETASRPGSK
jgi:hypothetical protein